MSLIAQLARARVPAGFVVAAMVLWLARPTWRPLLAGAVVAAAGQALRIWAAGHLDKGREVTMSGPYRLVRHPLYAGSTLMGAGLAIASWSVPVAVLIAAYLGMMLTVAIRSEEAWLRARFGQEYDLYVRGARGDSIRRFSLGRVRANREYRSVLGLLAVLLILAGKTALGG